MEPVETFSASTLNNPLIRSNGYEIHVGDPSEFSGNAPSAYRVLWETKDGVTAITDIQFQDGPLGEVGHNGVIDEVLTAILIHRIECWQSGKFANRENALVKTALEESLLWRLKRTLEREARNVEGTHQV